VSAGNHRPDHIEGVNLTPGERESASSAATSGHPAPGPLVELSAYIGLRAVTAALAIAESIPARPGRSLRALA
jgi:hypothetical protein